MDYRHTYPWQVATRRRALELSCRLGDGRPYDVGRMAEELDRILARYRAVPQGSIYDGGGWAGVSLVSVGGNPLELRPVPGVHEKTAALRMAPYLESILDSLETEITRVRVMGLAAGQHIYWHFDSDETADNGTKVRLHIPIATNRAVQFQLSHQDEFWGPGEFWYGDFSFPHRLFNGGTKTRYHMIMDVRINDFVRGLFPEGFLEQKPSRLAVKPFCQRSCDLFTMRLLRKVPAKIRQGDLLAASRRLVARKFNERRSAAGREDARR